MSVLKNLQREYKALESELRRIQEKIALYNEEIPRMEERLAELAEVIAHVSQLPRYKKENESMDSIPQNGGEENENLVD